MNDGVRILTDQIGDALSSRVSQAKSRLILAAPFIKRKALECLLSGLGASVELTILTRWRVDEIASGVSDLGVLDFVCERAGSRLLLHPQLHAKILLIDELVAIGSANITDAALGFTDRPNAEAVAVLDSAPNRVFFFLRQLERESVVATAGLRRMFEEATKVSPPPWRPPAVELTGEAACSSPGLFPRFRNPETLYSGYLSILSFSDSDTRASILDDLATLNLPEGLNERAFRLRVGSVLLAIPAIADFDRFVAQPRYFGEMHDWMISSGHFSPHGPEDCKGYLQTLVRWLLHFLPGRYRLEEPNYSELFGRADGWR